MAPIIVLAFFVLWAIAIVLVLRRARRRRGPAAMVPPEVLAVVAADPAPPVKPPTMPDSIVQSYAEWGSVVGRLADEVLELRGTVRAHHAHLAAIAAEARTVPEARPTPVLALPARVAALKRAEDERDRLLAVVAAVRRAARHCTDRPDLVARVAAMAGVIDSLTDHERFLDHIVGECVRALGGPGSFEGGLEAVAAEVERRCIELRLLVPIEARARAVYRGDEGAEDSLGVALDALDIHRAVSADERTRARTVRP